MAIGRQKFGDFFKAQRLKNGFTLRRFCEQFEFDPENISKIERGVFPAPDDTDLLTQYATALQIQKGHGDWIRFFDLATVSARTPIQPLTPEQIARKLPLLFRTQDNKSPDAEILDEIVKIVREA